jgi:hypothetical protein
MLKSKQTDTPSANRFSAGKQPDTANRTQACRVIPTVKVAFNVLLKLCLAVLFGWLMFIGSVSATRHM